MKILRSGNLEIESVDGSDNRLFTCTKITVWNQNKNPTYMFTFLKLGVNGFKLQFYLFFKEL